MEGTVYFFKPWVSGQIHGCYELQAYRKILAAAEASPPLLSNARICRLHGLIIDKDDDVLQHYHLDSDEEDFPGTRLVGLLLTYVENKGTLEDLAPWSDCTEEDRLRWSQQIFDSVRSLHAADVALLLEVIALIAPHSIFFKVSLVQPGLRLDVCCSFGKPLLKAGDF